MRENIAKKLSEAFIIIRDGYYAKANGEEYPKFKLSSAEAYLRDVCVYIDKKSDDTEREMIFFCLGALDDLKEEGDHAKTSRFAHAVHRIPFIFTGGEKWDKAFKREHIYPFCEMYGDDLFSEVLAIKVHSSPKERKKSIYRFNEMNIMSLKGYFAFRMMLPLIILPILIGAMLLVHFHDYTAENRGERYEITVSSYKCDGAYMEIYAEGHEDPFALARFREFSDYPDELISLCEAKAELVVYVRHVSSAKFEDRYEVIHLEDKNGKVYRSYEQSNGMDKYSLTFLGVFTLIVAVPSFTLFFMMLAVAKDPKNTQIARGL